MRQSESFPVALDPGTEGLIFVWKGAIRAAEGRRTITADEKDTLFLSGPIHLTTTNSTPGETVVIQVQTTPGPTPQPKVAALSRQLTANSRSLIAY